jgi:predicted transcriptional regulator
MDRLYKLKALEAKLKVAMETADHKTLASIARQYRETIKEIDELEGGATDDEIEDILQQRQNDGKSGAIRPSRT